MIGLEIRFTARRYDARGLNEDDRLDWPPSPWRVLRALVTAWRDEGHEVVTEAELRGLIAALSEGPPVYELPRASVEAERHGDGAQEGALLSVEGPVRVVWPEVTLSAEEVEALRRLVARVGYLGHAESWVEVTASGSWDGEANAAPEGWGVEGGERVEALTPMGQAEYARFRRGWLEMSEAELLAQKRREALEAGEPLDRARVTAQERREIAGRLGEDLVAALNVSEASLRRSGWSRPPGSRRVVYERPLGAITVAPRLRRPPRRAERAQVARYVVTSQAPPPMTDAVWIADDVHRALVDRSDGAPVFTGCLDDRSPRQDHHQHAHVFCEGYGRLGRLTHVTVYAPEGFDADARRCLEGLRYVSQRGAPDLLLQLIGVGLPDDMGGADPETGASPLFHTAQVWRSVTPFIATRHPKVTRAGRPKLDPTSRLQRGSPPHDLLRLIALQWLPAPEAIEPIVGARFGEVGRLTRWSHFRLRRRRGVRRRHPSPPVGFELRFAEPVAGPLAFGGERHFGLGLFAPA